MDQAAKGATALKEGKYADAVTQFSAAIARSPGAVDYYIKRSTAYQRSSPPDYEAALRDAEIAVKLSTQRAKRELIGQAQLRRGIALFGLGRYADAGQCFSISKRFNEKESSLLIWEKKVEGKLKEPEVGANGRSVTIEEVPDVELPNQKDALPDKHTLKTEESTKASSPNTATPLQTPANKIRHDWYQTSEFVMVELFAKGVPKDENIRVVDIEHQSVIRRPFHFSCRIYILNKHRYRYHSHCLLVQTTI